ncbi:hypothetical protein [Archangium violaceum]|uniref:hypothetical protein n=1 Tax=Archangium violaceum TaxID=83451 RepID=UPI001EF06DD3|nr:hypothetical protein [Archangium violaceum]
MGIGRKGRGHIRTLRSVLFRAPLEEYQEVALQASPGASHTPGHERVARVMSPLPSSLPISAYRTASRGPTHSRCFVKDISLRIGSAL